MRGEKLFILATGLLALAYHISPLSQMAFLSFNLVVVMFVFWVIVFEGQVSLSTAWLLGISEDVLMNGTLGEHALVMTLVGYLSIKMAKRLSYFSIWQQALCVLGLVLFNQLALAMIEAFKGHFADVRLILYPPLASFVLWPVFGLIAVKKQSLVEPL